MNLSVNDKPLSSGILKSRIDHSLTSYDFVRDCLSATRDLAKETEDHTVLLFYSMLSLGRFTKGTNALNDFVSLYENLGLADCAEKLRNNSFNANDLSFFWSSSKPYPTLFEESDVQPVRTYETGESRRNLGSVKLLPSSEQEPFYEIDKVVGPLPCKSWYLYELNDATIVYDTAEFAIFDKNGRPVINLCSDKYKHTYFTELFSQARDFIIQDQTINNHCINIDSALMIQDLIRAPNYCHWLLDQLPRTRHLKGGQKLIMYKLAPWMQTMLESMGISSDRVIELGERAIVRVQKLTIDSSMARQFSHPCQTVNPQLVDYIKSSFRTQEIDSADYSRIYLSRNRSARRRIVNEEELLKCLEPYNFKIIYPEELSVEEQVFVFKCARIIVSPHGASLANLVFCDRVSVIEIFNQNYGTLTFYLLCALLGFSYQHILGTNIMLSEAEKEEVGGAYLQNADMEVDIAKIKICLDRIIEIHSDKSKLVD